MFPPGYIDGEGDFDKPNNMTSAISEDELDRIDRHRQAQLKIPDQKVAASEWNRRVHVFIDSLVYSC